MRKPFTLVRADRLDMEGSALVTAAVGSSQGAHVRREASSISNHFAYSLVQALQRVRSLGRGGREAALTACTQQKFDPIKAEVSLAVARHLRRFFGLDS